LRGFSSREEAPVLTKSKALWLLYWVAVPVCFAAVTVMLFTYTPVEEKTGSVEKLFYIHMPAAICGFLACFAAFVGALGYLGKRQLIWDDLSAAGAKVAVLMCTVLLVTGVFWARKAWNTWWAWTPRLTFSLLLWLLYVVYLIVRSSIESPSRRANVCAVYAVTAFLDVPMVYLSVRLMDDPLHPISVPMTAPMALTLAAWFVPMILLTCGLIVAGRNRHRARREKNRPSVEDTPWSVADSTRHTP